VRNSNTQSVTNGYSDCDFYSYSYSNGDSHSYFNTDVDSKGYPNTKVDSRTPVSAHSAASPIRPVTL